MQMKTADRYTAVVLLALGLAMLAGGYTMDRLEIRHIHPASIPGLVPMILGALLSLCAVLLYLSTHKDTAHGQEVIFRDGSWGRLGVTACICTIYALFLVGWIPYFWATLVFTFLFTALFSVPVDATVPDKAKALASSAALAVCVAFGSAQLFEKLFLVRLP